MQNQSCSVTMPVVELQVATAVACPTKAQFQQWVNATVNHLAATASIALTDAIELTIRVVDNAEMQQLNADFRGKDAPTNVLAFPYTPLVLPSGFPHSVSGYDDVPLNVDLNVDEDLIESLAGGVAKEVAQISQETYLGDMVIAAPVVIEEASAQAKPINHHWMHLTVHGLLHLYGYDHQTDAEAEAMEAQEIAVLQALGVPNPYV
ncbi:rRNA maturation RNase YbeY [Ostreibacterium oceani]|nr:rRNA maturation RNase YbeY [Ostreibacterium oceani]